MFQVILIIKFYISDVKSLYIYKWHGTLIVNNCFLNKDNRTHSESIIKLSNKKRKSEKKIFFSRKGIKKIFFNVLAIDFWI